MKQVELLKYEDAKQGLLSVRLRLEDSWREEMCCCDLFETFFRTTFIQRESEFQDHHL